MYTNLPSLNVLKTFDAAARLKSFKKAAEELHVTPTAVSHQIKSLEEGLGTLLFERKTRAVALTREGELLFATSFKIFQQLAYTVNEISDSKELLTISATSSFASMWLVPNLGKFYSTHPDIEISIKAGEQQVNIERDRRIDLAIRYGRHDPMQPNASKLVTETIGMYATPSYLNKISGIDDAQFLETKWVNTSLPAVTWEGLLSRYKGIKSRPKYSVRQYDQEQYVIQAALAGQGIALVSSLLVRNILKQGWLVPYSDDVVHSNIEGLTYYLIVPPHNQSNKSVAMFIKWLSTEIRN